MSREEFDVDVEHALGKVACPPARAEFREGLRRRFCDCSEADSPPSRRFGLGILGLMAAAAVLAVGYFFFFPSNTTEWRVLEIATGSIVKADGVSLPVEDPAALARGLQGAREIFVERGDLVLQVGDLSLFDLGEGTRVAFAGFDDPDPTASYEVRATSGRLRARTGPGFAGRRMRVQADVIAAVVTGTAFAVDYEKDGTCVCCLHGTVEVVSEATGPEPRRVEPKHMCLVFTTRIKGAHDDREPLWGDPPASHAEPLMSLEARALEIWR